MLIRSTVLAAALAISGFSVAHADDIQPVQAKSIDLGVISGSAYYTVEPNGFRVVTTLSQGEAGTPVRLVAVLTPGQSVVLSTPREAGVELVEVEIARVDDTISVRDTALTN